MIKILIVIAFLFIVFNLGMALYHLMNAKDAKHSQKTAKALTFRIGLSLVLFIALIIALSLGLIKPHGIGANIQHFNAQKVPAKP
ncbi:MAG: twin transmembrane helix small protein [Methylococcaceae bacterium]|nr:twin transmembrane helix small protein [Methylococcaceae bacterium]